MPGENTGSTDESMAAQALALAVLLVSLGYRAWVAAMLWALFAEPLVGVAILPAQMLGLGLLWAAVWHDPAGRDSSAFSWKLVEACAVGAVYWTTLLCLGWTVALAGGL
jgi:hypothetical protein